MKCKALLGEIIKEGVHKGTMFKAIAWRGNFADQEITLQVGKSKSKGPGEGRSWARWVPVWLEAVVTKGKTKTGSVR